ncbi:TetR/AcrR family transcriptional regulator [Psychromicrobium sp. YIM B11713]|uniref:TetR/AcrR family transcriptional regulator n=1 Tax=Psychromicrobium sp. YIM B11713 TaxID=3145233 RepID=UPI00374E55D3
MPRVGLNRQTVTLAALKAVDDGGVHGFTELTLAAVAASAGVAVPSLYKHVASLADLKRAVALVAVGQLTERMSVATVGRAGPQAVQALAESWRSFALETPGRYLATQLAADPEDPADAELAGAGAAAVSLISGVLRGFQIPPRLDVDAVRLVRSAFHGFLTLELNGGFRLSDDLDQSYRRMVKAVVAGLQQFAVEGLPAKQS